MFTPQNTHHLLAHSRISQSLTPPHLWVHMYLLLLLYLLFPWGVTRLLFPSSFTLTIIGYRQKQNHKSQIHVMNSRKNEKRLFLQLLDLCSLVRDEISWRLRQIEDPTEDVKSFTTWIILWFYVNLISAGAGKKVKQWLTGSCGWKSDVNSFWPNQTVPVSLHMQNSSLNQEGSSWNTLT